jgi:hypothetical protein
VKTAELTERRAMLIARTEAQRQAASYYVSRLEAPARFLETSWRVAGFLRSPIILAALSLLLSARKKRARTKRRGWLWFLRQGWRIATALKHFGRG